MKRQWTRSWRKWTFLLIVFKLDLLDSWQNSTAHKQKLKHRIAKLEKGTQRLESGASVALSNEEGRETGERSKNSEVKDSIKKDTLKVPDTHSLKSSSSLSSKSKDD